MTRGHILVAGGSIGGLTTAVLLRDLGYTVDVFERSSAALQERGTGIVVLPITERYFMEGAGGVDGAARVSLELTDWTYVDGDGAVLSSTPDRYRFSAWNTLYRALLESFAMEHYHLDAEMVGFDQGDDRVTIHLADGREVTGDLLICADGVASTARRLLLPAITPEYTGYVAWRGVTSERMLSRETLDVVRDAMLYQVLDHSHILMYAIPDDDDSTTPGERIINTVWYRNYPTGGPFEALMTGVDGERRAATMPPGTVRAEFVQEMQSTAAATLAPPIREVVSKCAEPLIQAIFELESPQMVFDRVAILGDAAFALRPHVAAGQAKACADAWALHDALIETDHDVGAALAAWEPRQLELGRASVGRSREMGRQSQIDGTMVAGDPNWKFGLWEPQN